MRKRKEKHQEGRMPKRNNKFSLNIQKEQISPYLTKVSRAA